MKKLALVLLLGMFLIGSGCAAIHDSEFLLHETMYKNWDHTQYSQGGYWNPTAEAGKKSQEQGWWGIEIPYSP